MPSSYTLKVEAVSFSEMLENLYQTTQYYIPERTNLCIHCCLPTFFSTKISFLFFSVNLLVSFFVRLDVCGAIKLLTYVMK